MPITQFVLHRPTGPPSAGEWSDVMRCCEDVGELQLMAPFTASSIQEALGTINLLEDLSFPDPVTPPLFTSFTPKSLQLKKPSWDLRSKKKKKKKKKQSGTSLPPIECECIQISTSDLEVEVGDGCGSTAVDDP